MEAVLTQPLPVLLPAEAQFRCPDEPHTISRSVHLARLAAFYPKCRHCQHRHDTGHLPPTVVEQIQDVERQRAPQRSLFQTDGVRGVFHNELTPAIAGRIAGALASLLWEAVPLTARSSSAPGTIVKRSGPLVGIGYDERPASPVLFAMVADSLRMMGCEVVDLGQVSRACFMFAIDHLQAAGGVLVTGAGCEASWNGLDLVGEGALPLSYGTGLEEVERRLQDGYSRPTRRAGFQRAFQPLVPYEPSLWKHFHALRPLKIVTAIRPRTARETLRRLVSKLPCELIEIETMAGTQAPIRQSALLTSIAQRVARSGAHLGVLIDDDGCRCQFFDEKGRLIDAARLGTFLAKSLITGNPHATVCVKSSIFDDQKAALKSGNLIDAGETTGSLVQAMRSSGAVLGIAGNDTYWWRESCPTPDAILTLARVLQALSRSDAAFSAVLPKR